MSIFPYHCNSCGIMLQELCPNGDETKCPACYKGHIVDETTACDINFAPTLAYLALHQRVLVVATTRVEGTWKAYCSPVPGLNHEAEYEEVLRLGDAVEERIARIMFPMFKRLNYSS